MKKNHYLYLGLLMLVCGATSTSCVHSANENVTSTEKSFPSPVTPVSDTQSVITPLNSKAAENDVQRGDLSE